MKRKTVSGIVLSLLLIGILILTFNIQPVKAEAGTIYIRADGSVDPGTAPIQRDGDIYTFTDNIYDYEIVVERSNIIIDGNRHTLQGPGLWSGPPYYTGFYLNGESNVTIKNVTVKGWRFGLWFYYSSKNFISGNNITNNDYGIWFDYSSSNSIYGNNVVTNLIGFFQDGSNNNSIYGNNITDCAFGLEISDSSNNTISGNNITFFHPIYCGDGIRCIDAAYNRISGNNIIYSSERSISLYRSLGNSISGNNITSPPGGVEPCIFLRGSSKNSISGNNIVHNGELSSITDLESCSNNVFYHNNFILNRGYQAYDTNPAENDWHHPDLLEGNYWSDYLGDDDGSGTGKHAIADDGIGDTDIPWPGPDYDYYPLMNPWPPEYALKIYSSPSGVTFTVDGMSYATPWSGTYSEGASVNLVMPETYDGYAWSHWLEDGDPNRIKTVTMDTNINLTGVFSPKTLLGRGWGRMRIVPREYVYGPAELYKIGDTQIELVITCKGSEYSRRWNIIYHRKFKYVERYRCRSEEWGVLVVGLHKHRRWQFWNAVGKGVVARGRFPR